MHSLIENFILIQNIITGKNFELKKFYDKEDSHLIKYNNRTICFVSLYDHRREEEFNKEFNLSLNNIKYDCKFKFLEHKTNKIYHFKTLQELKNFLDKLNLENLI